MRARIKQKFSLNHNRPQLSLKMVLHRIKRATMIWGRGTGKSTSIADVKQEVVDTMPRATWAIQGSSYQQMLTRTLPSTFEALERIGYVRDVDYFVGKAPPSWVKTPYYKPLRYDNYITLVRPDGYSVGFTLMSQDRSGSTRGANVDGIIGDEALLLDPEKFFTEATFTNRGHNDYFGKVKLHHGILLFTSRPTGRTFLDETIEYYPEKGQEIIKKQNKLIEYQLAFVKAQTSKERLEIYSKYILPLMDEVTYYPSDKGVYHSEFNIFDNLENLSLRYLLDMYENTPEHIFLIEGLNKRVKKVDGGFYPTLNIEDIHGYKGSWNYSYLDNMDFDFEKLKSLDSRQDKDCNPNEGLFVGTDYGGVINWLTVGQEIKKSNRFNFIKDFYVKSPKIMDHVLEDFVKYYKHHKKKIVYLYPDAQGHHRQPNSKDTFVDNTRRILRKHGWTVQVMHNNKVNKPQHDTYLLWAKLLRGGNDHFPRIGFNTINCKDLIVSMEGAPAYDHNNQIKKNKNSEKKFITNREEATDASDAADQIIYYKYKNFLRDRTTTIPGLIHVQS